MAQRSNPLEASLAEGLQPDRLIRALELLVAEVRGELAGFKRELEKHGEILDWDRHGTSLPQRVESLQKKCEQVIEKVEEIEALLKKKQEQDTTFRQARMTIRGNILIAWIVGALGLLGTVIALLWPWLFGSSAVP